MSEALIELVKESEALLKNKILSDFASSKEIIRPMVSIIAPNVMAMFKKGYVSITIFLETDCDKHDFITQKQNTKFEEFCKEIVENELKIEGLGKMSEFNFVYDSKQNVIENHGGDFLRNLR